MQSPSSSPTRCTLYLRTNTLNHVICSNVCDGQLPPPDARTSHLRTLSKIANQASAPRFIPRRNHFRPREPHIIQGFYRPSIPCEAGFSAALPRNVYAARRGAHHAESKSEVEVLRLDAIRAAGQGAPT